MIRVALTLILALGFGAPAFADESTHAGATDDTFFGSGTATSDAAASTSGGATPVDSSGHWVTSPHACVGGAAKCGMEATCGTGVTLEEYDYVLADGTVAETRFACPDDSPRGPTLADIDHAFKQIPMHPSTIHIQPPKGETLVNFDTIFYTDPYTLDTSVTLLGATVAFHITVASYTWRYGDGHTQTTTDPGAPFPDQTITHRYLTKGTVDVTLATTYQADYSINGGPTQHLTDTVTITSPPQQLTVLTATPHLVAN